MSDQKLPIPPCFDCDTAPIERLTEMFVGIVQQKRITLGQRPAERPVFRKLHGVVHGQLRMVPDMPSHLKVGVFAADHDLQVWVRFSSDTSPTSPDLGSTLGIGIKVFGVPGPRAFGEAGDTADFILQNFPVFFVDDAKAMCEFTYAGVVQGDYPSYLSRHKETSEILARMGEKIEGSVLTTTYWGILPFGAGPGQVVKYRLEPETSPENVANDASDYLATDLANRLSKRAYQFRFMVQLRTHPKTMPLDQATVEWPEAESPFIQVATLEIPRQDVEARGQAEYGQSLAFNIFRVPPEQAPVPESSIAAVRKAVYAASADVRHNANGQSLEDPSRPRRVEPTTTPADSCIVKAVIYPSIGIARVGNSQKEWFIGPETPDPAPLPPGSYRDKRGALKRQAARFRVYGVDAKGTIVRELTGADDQVDIVWSVELANTKSAWYGFQLALDIPEAASAPPTTLRNAATADRSRLAITPGDRAVGGRNARPKAFDTGSFMGEKVYLGEIFTDEAGRLLVLGGRGKASSCDKAWAITFANNEGWYDDISDGPVTAEVTLNGTKLDVLPAWVVVGPPNFGPQRKSVRTLWDLMRDVGIKAGLLGAPVRPSFTRDILPIFQRLNGLQWVNAGFAAGFGWEGEFDFSTPQGLAKLADRGSAAQELRRVIANSFRRFDTDSWSPKPWPWLYGDAMSLPPAPTPRQNAALSDCQLAMLDQWAMGDFEADYDPAYVPPSDIAQVPVTEQGDVLTKAALEFCLADAFHPGCEMTWPVRASTLYMAPFRFAHALKDWVAPNLGEVFTSDNITLPNGPLYGQTPGGITRWMAVPWQTDSASCRSGYVKSYDPYVPAFWPARVPDQVLTRENYEIVMDKDRPLAERRAAFANRASWINPLGTTSYTDQINNMIAHFDHLGVVEVHPGPEDTDAFPAILEVEDQHKPIPDEISKNRKTNSLKSVSEAGHAHAGAPGTAREIDISGIDKFHRFPGGLPIQVK